MENNQSNEKPKLSKLGTVSQLSNALTFNELIKVNTSAGIQLVALNVNVSNQMKIMKYSTKKMAD